MRKQSIPPPTHRLPLLSRLPRRRRRQERRPVDSPPLRRRPGRLQDAQALGSVGRPVGVVVVLLLFLFLVAFVVVVVVDEPLALPVAAAAVAKDPAGDGEGGGREGRGGAQFVEAVLKVVASVLQTRDVGAEAAFGSGRNTKS